MNIYRFLSVFVCAAVTIFCAPSVATALPIAVCNGVSILPSATPGQTAQFILHISENGTATNDALALGPNNDIDCVIYDSSNSSTFTGGDLSLAPGSPDDGIVSAGSITIGSGSIAVHFSGNNVGTSVVTVYIDVTYK